MVSVVTHNHKQSCLGVIVYSIKDRGGRGEAPAPVPKAKAKAKPAPVVEEDEAEDTAPEPEVRKAAPKATAVPAGKSSLANILADWDDE